jgi:pimeloyl-ACP methyl ester carboxylesterase
MAAKKTTRARPASRRKPSPSRATPRGRSAAVVVAALLALVVLPPLGRALFGWGTYEDSLPMHGSPIVVGDGLVLNVLERGKGTPVILVHGLPSSATDWGRVPELLAGRGLRAISYDRMGFGYSSRVATEGDNFTLASNARDLLALMDALGLPKALLVGWSYGGGVVQTVAAMAPARVEGLVLLGSIGPALDDHDDSLDALMQTPLAKPVLSWVGAVPPLGRALVWQQLRTAFATEGEIPDGWLPYTQAMMALPGTLDSFVAEWRRLDLAGLRPESLRTRALVLHGALDRSVPLAVGEDLDRRLPESRLVVVADGGHMLPVSQPERVVAEIAAFAGR